MSVSEILNYGLASQLYHPQAPKPAAEAKTQPQARVFTSKPADPSTVATKFSSAAAVPSSLPASGLARQILNTPHGAALVANHAVNFYGAVKAGSQKHAPDQKSYATAVFGKSGASQTQGLTSSFVEPVAGDKEQEQLT